MPLRHRLVLLAALAAAAGFAMSPAPRAFADDGGGDGGGGGGGGGHGGGKGEGGEGKEGGEGGEGPEMGDEEGPAVEKPTLDGALDVGDPKRYVSVKVPKSWKIPEGYEAQGAQIAFFSGPMTEKIGGGLEVILDRSYSRAALALSNHIPQIGAVEAGEERSGPGWAEAAATFFRGPRELICWERAMEKDGVVLSVRVLTFKKAKADARALARQILDTAKVASAPSAPAVPAGFSVKKAGAYDIWTDSDDKSKPGKVADIADEARSVAAKCLKGKPYDDGRSVLRAYQVGAGYVEALRDTYGETPDHAAYDPVTRSLCVQLYRLDDDEFAARVRDAAARQYVAAYFGGAPPLWLDLGLRRYVTITVEAGGKPDKPKGAWQNDLRTAVSKDCKTLEQWMDTGGGGASADAAQALELWGWQVFLRNGTGKKYGKQLQAYVDTLRQSGDVAAARKAWDGVDMAAMKDEFRNWALGWK